MSGVATGADAPTSPTAVASAGRVSSSNPDPNFRGTDHDGTLGWSERQGMPKLSSAAGPVLYLGFDATTRTSYLLIYDPRPRLVAYTRSSGPVDADTLPRGLVKPPWLAGSRLVYGDDAASAEPTTATSDDAFDGTSRIAKDGTGWHLVFGDRGAPRSLRITRPHVSGGPLHIDYDAVEWAKPIYASGIGMWVAVEADGSLRVIDAVAGDPSRPAPRVVRVDVGPSLPRAQWIDYLRQRGIRYLDDDAAH